MDGQSGLRRLPTWTCSWHCLLVAGLIHSSQTLATSSHSFKSRLLHYALCQYDCGVELRFIQWYREGYFDALREDCNASIANALELLQSCSKPSILMFAASPLTPQPYTMERAATWYSWLHFDFPSAYPDTVVRAANIHLWKHNNALEINDKLYFAWR